MTIFSQQLVFQSSKRRELIDLTPQVLACVENSKVVNGSCVVAVPHATAAIIANERETGLMDDILSKIGELFPVSSKYRHNKIDDNADAHLASAFLGNSRMFPIVDGRLIQGTWQNIFLVELDGPRSGREVYVQVTGER